MVIPLYYGHQIIIGRRIERDKFCLQELPTNEVFDGRPALFDMLNIFVGPSDESERQMICRPPDVRRCTFVCNHPSVEVDNQTTFVIHFFVHLSSARGTSPSGSGRFKGEFHETTNMNEIDHRGIKISRQVLQTSRHRRLDIGTVQWRD